MLGQGNGPPLGVEDSMGFFAGPKGVTGGFRVSVGASSQDTKMGEVMDDDTSKVWFMMD